MTAGASGRFAGHPRLGGHDAATGTDTHGLPWEGRRVEAARYAQDSGAAEPALVLALAAWAGALPRERIVAEEAAVAALAGARVLVPLLAGPDDEAAATVSAMGTPVLRGPDGSSALPVFTSVASLHAWDPTARPVPTPVRDACRAALEEGCVAAVVDVTEPHAAVLRLSHLWALTAGERWVPAHADPVVRLAVAEAAQGVGGLLAARCEDGSSVHAPGTLRVVLTLAPGLGPRAVDGVVSRIGERLAADPDVRRRIDDIAVIVRRPEDPRDAVPPEAPGGDPPR